MPSRVSARSTSGPGRPSSTRSHTATTEPAATPTSPRPGSARPAATVRPSPSSASTRATVGHTSRSATRYSRRTIDPTVALICPLAPSPGPDAPSRTDAPAVAAAPPRVDSVTTTRDRARSSCCTVTSWASPPSSRPPTTSEPAATRSSDRGSGSGDGSRVTSTSRAESTGPTTVADLGARSPVAEPADALSCSCAWRSRAAAASRNLSAVTCRAGRSRSCHPVPNASASTPRHPVDRTLRSNEIAMSSRSREARRRRVASDRSASGSAPSCGMGADGTGRAARRQRGPQPGTADGSVVQAVARPGSTTPCPKLGSVPGVPLSVAVLWIRLRVCSADSLGCAESDRAASAVT